MRPTAAASARLVSLAGCLLAFATSGNRAAADSTEQEQFEDKLINRWVEKGYRIARSDRTQWVKELENAFPDKVVNATTENEYLSWFVLLAGKADAWRREDAPNAQIAELFDKIVQRLELGPVPSVRRDEFMKYAKHVLMPANPQAPAPGADPVEDADKVFRVLDRNGDGVLRGEELTSGLRADLQGSGRNIDRVTKEEYRAYFNRRVGTGIDAALARKAAEKAGDKSRAEGKDAKTPVPAGKAGKAGPPLPNWFAELDPNNSGQIALHEWRKSGRPIALFMEMDLNGDGLLTRDEYLRYARVKEKERGDETPPPTKPVKN